MGVRCSWREQQPSAKRRRRASLRLCMACPPGQTWHLLQTLSPVGILLISPVIRAAANSSPSLRPNVMAAQQRCRRTTQSGHGQSTAKHWLLVEIR